MSKKKICLDPGHYGLYNQSPQVPAYYESEAMWKLHLYLKTALETRGFQVITTRQEAEKDLGLSARGKLAAGCDAFISLHSNACATESVDYTIVYRAYDNLNNADEIAKKLGVEIGKLMGNKQTGKSGSRKSEKGDWDYYGVMRGARVAGCPLYLLIEHSFHTNKEATLWLLEEENLKKLADLEADILAEHFGQEAQAPENQTQDTSNYTTIMGESLATAGQMEAYLRQVNPDATGYFSLAETYFNQGQVEGVRGDLAFAQALVETGNFTFGGDVSPEQNNFCGLGATGNGQPGCEFATPELGVQAQIQHLQAYGCDTPLKQACVDPRYSYVTRNCAPYVEWLGIQEHPEGKGWAAGANYGAKILAIMDKIQAMDPPAEPEKIPDWMAPSVTWMGENGLMAGDGQGNLRVNDPVTRGELAVILAKYHQIFGENPEK